MSPFVETIQRVLGHAPDSTPPGKWVRFATSDKRGDLNGWARLFDDGEGGSFGCWRQGISEIWQARQPRSEEERREFAERIRQNKERAEKELADLRAECRGKSAKLWEKAKPADPKHPYLVSKGIDAHQIRQIAESLLVPVRGSGGALRGLQFIGPDGSKKFKTGTEITGSYCSIGRPNEKTLLICEGWATGGTLNETTGHAVAVAFNAGNLMAVCKALRAKYPDWRLIVCADDDHATPGNPGLITATEAALAVVGLLAVPDFTGTERGQKVTDFNDLAKLAGAEIVKLCIEAAEHPKPNPFPPKETPPQGESESDTVTETPLLFDEIHTPELPASLLPGWLGEYAEAVARSTQTPEAMAVMLALSTAATCTAKRFEVSPHGEGYTEPLNLWTATALPPASRKTAVTSAMTGPLVEWEKSEADRLAPEIKMATIKRRTLQKRIDKLEKDSASANDPARRDELLAEIEKTEQEMPEELRAPRLWTGDTTPERLQSLLADHGERMAVLSDEGGIFDIMAGLYSDGRANLDIFLQGHAGKSVRVDRQGRTAHLDAPALTFGLAIQPAVLADMGTGGKKRFRGNGTLARFLYAVPRSNIGTRNVKDNYQIPAAVAARYRAGLFDLLAVLPPIIDNRELPQRLTLTPDALDSWQAFAQMVEERQGEGGDLESIQDWSGKLPGAALRIAGNFHLVEHGGNPPRQIEEFTMGKALDLCALLIDHAKAAFNMMEADPETADAKAILKWIESERLPRFKKGALWAKFKGRFTGKTGRLDKAIKDLETRSIIFPATEQTPGRPAKVFTVNPALWGGA